MVSVHVGKLPDFRLVCIMANRTKWAIRFACCFCLFCLCGIDSTLSCLVKNTDIQKLRISFPTKNVSENPTPIFDKRVAVQALYLFMYIAWIIRLLVICFIQQSPLKAAHFALDISKHGRDPVDYGTK